MAQSCPWRLRTSGDEKESVGRGGQQRSLSTSLSIHCLPRRASFGPHGKPVYRPSRQRTTRSTMPRACVGMDGVPCCFSASFAGRPAQPSPNHLQCLFCGDLARLEDVLNGPGGKPLVLRMLCAAELVFSLRHCLNRLACLFAFV